MILFSKFENSMRAGFAIALVATLSVAPAAQAFDASGGAGSGSGASGAADGAGGGDRSGETHGVEDRGTFSSPAAVARALNPGATSTPTFSSTGVLPSSPFLTNLRTCSGINDPRCR